MQAPATDRLVSGAAALAVEVLLCAMLLFGLAIRSTTHIDDTLKVFDVVVPPNKPPRLHPPPPRKTTPHRASRAAPRDLKARPTEIVRPPPVVLIPTPPPVVTALVGGDGAMAHAGMARLPGPGPGAGGRGNGSGSGGDGDGGGGTAPQRIKGRIRDSDYPRGLWAAGVGGTVSVRYHVEVDGRATGCSVTGSSGNSELDAVTCRLIEQRFRYRAALDEEGRPVRSSIVENHSWIIDDSELLETAGKG